MPASIFVAVAVPSQCRPVFYGVSLIDLPEVCIVSQVVLSF